MQTASTIFLSFCVYSFLGWVCETVYCSVGRRHFVNRGFLAGPVCPVYGFGALAVLYLLAPFSHRPILLYFSAMLVTSALEYLTGFLLERLFHTRWWDYSTYRFNLHGRVCLKNSLLFGLIALIMVLFIDPAVQQGLLRLPPPAAAALALALLAAFAADTVQSARSALALGQKAEQLAALRAELHERAESYREALHESIRQYADEGEALREGIRERIEALPRFEGSEEMRRELREKLEGLPHAARPVSEALHARLDELRARADELRERLDQLSRSRERLAEASARHRRLLAAFPGMRSTRHEGALEELKRLLDERRGHHAGKDTGKDAQQRESR